MTTEPCSLFLEDLAAVVDGDELILAKHLEHLTGCDACRDARHEAAELATSLVDAGADYVHPADMEARVLADIDDDTAATESAIASATPSAAANDTPANEGAASGDGKQSPKRGRGVFLFAAAAVAIAAGGITATRLGGDETDSTRAPTVTADIGTSARLQRIERAAGDGVRGVLAKSPNASEFSAVDEGARLDPGTQIKTDDRTRVRLVLNDGSKLSVNHRTLLTLGATAARHVALAKGEFVADVAHLEDNSTASFETPTGRIDVIGTQFVLSATDDFTSVRVTRGHVRLTGTGRVPSTVDVLPGEEGTIEASGAPSVGATINLAGAVAWSEMLGGPADNDVKSSEGSAGIGELRAFRPGEKRDKDWPLVLANHKVTVRIVGNVARTEIEETFRNDAAHQLEGVYKFPLPADAKIDRLALDVKDGFEEGAFVDKRRAAKIWRGVINKAAPKERRRPRQEIIWVPGPWRDPALLEWKRGGRFELRVFPIPAKGQRTIKIGYTQTIRPHGERRRYVYPLAHSADQSTAVENFDVDVRVAGADPDYPVQTYGYDFERAKDAGDATRLALSKKRFIPRGNIIVEYRLPNSDTELRAWTFVGDVAAAPSTEKIKRGTGLDPKIVAAQRKIARDKRPTVLLALRPKLPQWRQSRERDYVLVVDSSRSMVGERFARASKLATALIGQMDRRDRFTITACDIDCRQLPGAMQRPTAALSRKVRSWLSEIEPAGASNLTNALAKSVASAAATRGAADTKRETWVIYMGDGMSTVGHRRIGAVARSVASLASKAAVTISTVGIGGDADAAGLAAIARAGGGHYVPYVPGQRIEGAALAVLETTFGVSLRDATVELPAGLTDTAPGTLPTLRAGNEFLIAGRFSGTVTGDVILRGSVGGKPYENRFPIALKPSTSRGNGFVPRMWASLLIHKLELDDRGEDRARIVALSKAYGVLSRHTSLLVLESEKMFKAFGVDRSQPSVRWTGEEDADLSESVGDISFDSSTSGGGMGMGVGDLGTRGRGGSGASVASGKSKGPRRAKKARASSERKPPSADSARARTKAKPSKPMPNSRTENDIECLVDPNSAACKLSARREAKRRVRRHRRMVPMKRVWFREARIADYTGVSENIRRAVAQFDANLRASPDSREKHRALVQALSYAGELTRAYDVASRWLERDRLDPQALVYMADILGRQGRRAEAIRMLSGIVDIQPDSIALHERLAKAYARVGDAERACWHRITLAELESESASRVGLAVRCQKALGHGAGAEYLLASMSSEKTRSRAARVAAKPATSERSSGELVVDATWTGATDVDITIITPRGIRLSWLGGRKEVRAANAGDLGRERLALTRIKKGNYLVEVSRADATDKTPVAGQLQLKVLGVKQRLDFRLDPSHSERSVVGQIRVRFQSRLEPI